MRRGMKMLFRLALGVSRSLASECRPKRPHGLVDRLDDHEVGPGRAAGLTRRRGGVARPRKTPNIPLKTKANSMTAMTRSMKTGRRGRTRRGSASSSDRRAPRGKGGKRCGRWAGPIHPVLAVRSTRQGVVAGFRSNLGRTHRLHSRSVERPRRGAAGKRVVLRRGMGSRGPSGGSMVRSCTAWRGRRRHRRGWCGLDGRCGKALVMDSGPTWLDSWSKATTARCPVVGVVIIDGDHRQMLGGDTDATSSDSGAPPRLHLAASAGSPSRR